MQGSSSWPVKKYFNYHAIKLISITKYTIKKKVDKETENYEAKT